jgi:hypothetical protein
MKQAIALTKLGLTTQTLPACRTNKKRGIRADESYFENNNERI